MWPLSVITFLTIMKRTKLRSVCERATTYCKTSLKKNVHRKLVSQLFAKHILLVLTMNISGIIPASLSSCSASTLSQLSWYHKLAGSTFWEFIILDFLYPIRFKHWLKCFCAHTTFDLSYIFQLIDFNRLCAITLLGTNIAAICHRQLLACDVWKLEFKIWILDFKSAALQFYAI